MKRTLSALALSVAFSTFALAANFSGKLIDSPCNDQKAQTNAASCDATSATTSFALDVNGKIYKLDAAGNSKAAAALHDRADRSADPAKATAPGAVNVKVTGTEKSGTITVETVEVQ